MPEGEEFNCAHDVFIRVNEGKTNSRDRLDGGEEEDEEGVK